MPRLLLAGMLAAFALVPANAHAATPPSVPPGLPAPDQLSPKIYPPASQTARPPGFTVNARQAVQLALRVPAVQEARRKHPGMKATPFISPLAVPQGSFYHWDVYFEDAGKNVIEVEIGPGGDTLVVTRGLDIGWPIVTGLPGVLGKKLNAPYVWLPLCLIFLLPFVDPKRWRRLLHLDLAMLLLFGISHFFFNLGKPDVSVPLFYPFLVYAAVRGLMTVLRPKKREGPLAPWVTTRFLMTGVAVLLALRIVFCIVGSQAFDISTAGVIGADRIEHGLQLYTDNETHGDTYGPINYLAYMPGELVFPYKAPEFSVQKAARTTTIGLDILMVIALLVLGRRLRPGATGRRLGAALAWAWVAFPYSALILAANTNDALVPLFVIWALIVIESPLKRGVVSALGTMTKFAPVLLAPMLAVGRGPFRWRSVLIVAAAYVVVCGGLIWFFLPDGGLHEFWNTTLGFQLHRRSPLSLWIRHPEIEWMKSIFPILAAIGAVVAAFVPKRRTVGQLAGWSVAILATVQIGGAYWLYFYIAWFAPLLFIALFEEYPDLGPTRSGQGDERLREPRQNLATVVGNGDQVLDTHAQHAG